MDPKDEDLIALFRRLEKLDCGYEIRKFNYEHYAIRLSGSEFFHEGRSLIQVLEYALPDEGG